MDVGTTFGPLVLTIGAPVLVLFYYVEGLLVGKLLHPSILFILFIVVTDPSLLAMGFIAMLCVISATAGQATLYLGFSDRADEQHWINRVVPFFDRVPSIVRSRIGTKRMEFINRQFDRFGGKAICVSNATPGLRGMMTVIAGLNRYPLRRFILWSAAGNAIYMVLLLAVATGVLGLAAYVPWDLDLPSI